jgi:hypothetical protein
MKSKFALTRRKRLILATVVICTVLIAGLAILWQGGGKVSEAALLDAHPGLVGWWHFDEGAGTVANDSSGNGNNGTITGASWVAGRYGNALSFNGIDNYVQVPDSSSLHITTALTITAWIKTTGSGMTFRNRIVDKWGSNNQGGGWNLNIWDSSGKLGFEQRYSDGSQMFVTGLQGNTVVTDNAWHFVCARLDSGTATAKLYVDGQLDAQSTSFTNPLLSNNENLAIGAFFNGGNFFNGITDEVQIYNRALSATEIQAYYQSPGFSPSLLAKVPNGTTDFIATVSWQGTGSINVTIQSPSNIYTESNATGVYQKTTYSASGGTSTMLNIKRLEVSVGALASDQNWYIVLVTSNVQDYKITVEVQK